LENNQGYTMMHGQPIIKMTRYGLGLGLVLLEKLYLFRQ